MKESRRISITDGIRGRECWGWTTGEGSCKSWYLIGRFATVFHFAHQSWETLGSLGNGLGAMSDILGMLGSISQDSWGYEAKTAVGRSGRSEKLERTGKLRKEKR